MQRKRRLDLETLESRALLSGLSFSLTTNQAAYKVGQAIQMTFTETNTSNQSLTVPVKPVDFTVAQNNALIWQSNPGNQTLPPTIETLKPGQSVTQTATWDGMTGGLTAPVSGPPVSAGVNHWGDFVVSNPNVPPGQNLTASFQISDPISQTLTTSQSVYQVGQTVQMTYTETNTANQSITFANPGPAGFTIMHDGKAVLIPILPTTYSLPTITLKAGQTITDTQTWNGTSTVAGSGILTGTFTAEFGPSLQPNMLTTNFQIAPPPQAVNLVTSITTDHSVYTLGQPVNITFTETNQGDQPVSIESGPPAIQITQNGKVVWDDDYTGTRTTETLQPGQSITQTAVWSESAITTTNAAPTIGTFVVTNTLDPNDSTATFQIIGPPNPSRRSSAESESRPTLAAGIHQPASGDDAADVHQANRHDDPAGLQQRAEGPHYDDANRRQQKEGSVVPASRRGWVQHLARLDRSLQLDPCQLGLQGADDQAGTDRQVDDCLEWPPEPAGCDRVECWHLHDRGRGRWLRGDFDRHDQVTFAAALSDGSRIVPGG